MTNKPEIKLRSLNFYVQRVYYEHAGTMRPVEFTPVRITDTEDRTGMAGFRLRIADRLLCVFWR